MPPQWIRSPASALRRLLRRGNAFIVGISHAGMRCTREACAVEPDDPPTVLVLGQSVAGLAGCERFG